MRNIIYVILAVLTMAGCKKESKPLDITGTWELVDIKTRAAQLGDQTMEVFITFKSDDTYIVSQKIGQGRYHEYSGKWKLAGTTLSGDYSDGSKWGATYDVSVTDDQMTLTPQLDNAESYMYVRISM
ncbi:MAG: lipocalin family protein [Bacteroidales bacterium]|nr:lipocalin family protein [Bacteroidales bacterium]